MIVKVISKIVLIELTILFSTRQLLEFSLPHTNNRLTLVSFSYSTITFILIVYPSFTTVNTFYTIIFWFFSPLTPIICISPVITAPPPPMAWCFQNPIPTVLEYLQQQESLMHWHLPRNSCAVHKIPLILSKGF